MKVLIAVIIGFLLVSCGHEQDKEDFLNKKNTPKYNTETFAVVWKTVSMRKEKLEEIVPSQAKQLQSLWEAGIVENVYFKTDEKFGEDETWPNIMFFLKVKNLEAAEDQLDKMDFVIHKLATYELHPVGVLWLARNEKTLEKIHESKKTYAVVWKNGMENQPNDEDIKLQSDDFTKLWNDGFIENAYFDIIGASTGVKDRPTVVNFVNAKNEDEANTILSDLHFVKSGLSNYMLFDVGLLWLGVKEN